MRCGLYQGRYLLLHPEWCVGPKKKRPPQNNQTIGTGEGSNGRPSQQQDDGEETSIEDSDSKVAQKSPADRRQSMDPCVYSLVNPGEGGCLRLICLANFNDTTYQSRFECRPRPCCSRCDPEFAKSTANHEAVDRRMGIDLVQRPWNIKELTAWRQSKAQSLYGDCPYGVIPTLVMPDSYLHSIAKWGSRIVDEATLVRWAGQWADSSIYWEEIIGILNRGRELGQSRASPVTLEYRAYNANRRCGSLKPNTTIADEREGRRNNWLIQKGYPCAPPSKKRSRAIKEQYGGAGGLQSLGEESSPAGSQIQLISTLINSQSNTEGAVESTHTISPAGATNSHQLSGPAATGLLPGREPLQALDNNRRLPQSTLPDSRSGRKRRLPHHLQE